MIDPIREAFVERMHENPFDKENRLFFADWCDEHDEIDRAEILRSGRIPLDSFDKIAVSSLAGRRFAPGTWDKRFANQIVKSLILTPRQYCWLWIFLRKYRRSVQTAQGKRVLLLLEAEKRNKPYQKLLEAEIVKPTDRKPQPKTRTGRSARKAKMSRAVKSAAMPLFD